MAFPKYSLRSQMILLALLGLVFGAAITTYRRYDNLRQLARFHEDRCVKLQMSVPMLQVFLDGKPSSEPERLRELSQYHWYLFARAERASEHFWLPFKPDPDLSLETLETIREARLKMEHGYATYR